MALNPNGDSYVSIPQPVINWLFGVIQPIYYSKKTVFHDSVAVLSYYKQLRPRTRVYTDSNGVSELLLCIYGKPVLNLPVPLLIWIPRSYPVEAPIVYIDFESLKDTKVSPGKHVDANGLISLPLFERWNPEGCNLLQVVQECVKICRYDHVIDPVSLQDENIYLSLPPKLPPNPVTEVSKPPLPKKSSFECQASADCVVPLNTASRTTPSVSPPRLPQKPPVGLSLDLLDSSSEGTDSTHKAILKDLRRALDLMNEADISYINENFQKRKLSISSAKSQFESMYRYEIDSLNNIKESIEVAKVSLRDELDLIQNYSDKIKLYEKENPGEVDLAYLVRAENPMLEQLYELVARDYALSDAMCLLSRLLSCDTLSVDVFVKRTRQSAREQFFTRMHIQKVIEGLRQQ